jgi:hypothetical protein
MADRSQHRSPCSGLGQIAAFRRHIQSSRLPVNEKRNIYICPGGAELTSTGNIEQGHTLYYRAKKSDCSTCLLKPRCTTALVRKVTRDLDEEVRDRVRRRGDRVGNRTRPFGIERQDCRSAIPSLMAEKPTWSGHRRNGGFDPEPT